LLKERLCHYYEDELPKNKALFEKLSHGQNPEILLITCSDSRVAPNLLLNAKAGEIFIIRNPGNIVMPYDQANNTYGSECVMISFALENLPIKEVIVLGHEDCGGIAAEKTGHLKWRDDRSSQENIRKQLGHIQTYPAFKKKNPKTYGLYFEMSSGNLLLMDDKGFFSKPKLD